MQPLDLIVYAAIAGVALYPLAGRAASLFRPLLSGLSKPAAVKEQLWRQRWSATLIDFLDEVEGGRAAIDRPEQAVVLARELVWEIIGGDPQPAAKSK